MDHQESLRESESADKYDSHRAEAKVAYISRGLNDGVTKARGGKHVYRQHRGRNRSSDQGKTLWINSLSSYRISYLQEYLDCQGDQEDPEGDQDKGESD